MCESHDIKTASLAAWIYGRYMFSFKQISYFQHFEWKSGWENEALKVRKKISMISNAFANNSTHWLQYNVINGMEKWNVCTTCHHHQQSRVNHSQSVYIFNTLTQSQAKEKIESETNEKKNLFFFSHTRTYFRQDFSMIASIQYQPWYVSWHRMWGIIYDNLLPASEIKNQYTQRNSSLAFALLIYLKLCFPFGCEYTQSTNNARCRNVVWFFFSSKNR